MPITTSIRGKMRAAEKRTAKIGWLVTCGIAVVTGIVLKVVMDAHNTPATRGWSGGRPWPDPALDGEFRKLNQMLATLIKTRSLKEKLSAIEAHFEGALTIDVLGKDFVGVRDPEFEMDATEAGGDLLARYNAAVKQATKRFVDALRAAADAVASATSGERLALCCWLEDTIRKQQAMPKKDADAEAVCQQTCEIFSRLNGIVARPFDEASPNRVPWTNLLADTSGWTIIPSRSFKYTFDAGLTLVNEPGEQSGAGGLCYAPADKWRDYVLVVELQLDSGVLDFYTRIGDRLDPKQVPGFTVGTKSANILIGHGKVYDLVITTIGNQLTVTGEGISPYSQPIESTKSHTGKPGIVAEAGTTATITKLRARHLR